VFILQYAIFYRGNEIGQLSIEPEGLYYRLSAQCREPGPGVWRLWGCFGLECQSLGVFSPGVGGLELEKRVSRHSWPRLPDCFTLGREIEGFRPWRGSLEGCEIPHALLRQNEDGTQTLALFPPAEGPVPLAEYVPQMGEGEIAGQPCPFLELPEKFER
jgi:hypothetical protein